MKDHVKNHKCLQQTLFSLNQRLVEWNIIPKNPMRESPAPIYSRTGSFKDVKQKESDNKLEMLQINRGDINHSITKRKGNILSVAQINETWRLF